MEIELDGNKIKVNIIGGFQVNEKNYAVCSYEDERNHHKLVIIQVVEDQTGMHALDIPETDKEEVLRTYTEVKNRILEEEYEG